MPGLAELQIGFVVHFFDLFGITCSHATPAASSMTNTHVFPQAEHRARSPWLVHPDEITEPPSLLATRLVRIKCSRQQSIFVAMSYPFAITVTMPPFLPAYSVVIGEPIVFFAISLTLARSDCSAETSPALLTPVEMS